MRGTAVAPPLNGSVRALIPITLAVLLAAPAAAGPVRGARAKPRRASPTSGPRKASRPVARPLRSALSSRLTRRRPRPELHVKALQTIRRAKTLVFDIDITVVDTRPRTVAAVKKFARTSRSLDRQTRQRLLQVEKNDIGYDGHETATKLGLNRIQAKHFTKIWSEVFWSPKSLALDEPIAEVVQLIKASKNKNIVFLTGRYQSYTKATIAQLERLGLPTDRVLLKPDGESTPAFKARMMKSIGARGGRSVLVDDSPRNLAAVDSAKTRATTIAIDFPIREPGQTKRAKGAPALSPSLP